MLLLNINAQQARFKNQIAIIKAPESKEIPWILQSINYTNNIEGLEKKP